MQNPQEVQHAVAALRSALARGKADLSRPPVGLVLFVPSSVTRYPVTTVIRGALPFFVPMLATLVVIALVPALSLWLPGLMGF